MSFDRPLLLFLALLIFPLLLDIFLRRKKRFNGIEVLSAALPEDERETSKRMFLIRIILSDLFFILFTVFTVLSLSGPRWGTELRADMRRGLDLVLAFDISRSMNARDCPPAGRMPETGAVSTRLERALALARELCLRLDNIRYATAAGKGQGVLMIPVTYDTEAVFVFLDSLDDSMLTGGGTNLESLLDSAALAFRDNMNRRKGIILFTDGEIHQGSLDAALNRANAAGIIVSTAGFGSNNGSPVPVETSSAAPDGFLLDPGGMPVISFRQEDALINAAVKSGGIYVDGNRNDAALALADFYSSFAPEMPGGFRRESIERWQLVLFLGLISLCLSRLLVFKRRNIKRGAAALACLFLLILSSCGPLQGKLLVMEGNYHSSNHNYNEAISSYFMALEYEDVTPYAEYGLGLSYSRLDENEAALERYAAAEKNLESLVRAEGEHQELRYRISFNTGVIHFEQGNFQNAAESFRRSLEIDGSRIDAKRNLELSLLETARQNQSEAAARQDSGSVETSSLAAQHTAQEGAEALLDYLREKSAEQWSNQWQEETDPIWPDY